MKIQALPLHDPRLLSLRDAVPVGRGHPPLLLYIESRDDEALKLLERMPSRGLAVVGTRKPAARSVLETSRRIRELSGSDLMIVSGFAHGIDAAAHEAALRCGLPTVAILGCGLEIDYPRGHRDLRRRIVEAGGLILTEFEPRAEPLAGQFISRNRLIAWWTHATWVVEAPLRSGALSTMSYARRAERHCFATPGYPGDPALAGNQKLLDDECAVALWGAHSLGKAWLELSARAPGRKSIKTLRGDVAWLLRQIRLQTSHQGGAWTTSLLDLFVRSDESRTAEQFFGMVDALRNERLIEDRGGLLLSKN